MPCSVVTAVAEAAVLSTCLLLIYMHVHVSEVAELFATVCRNSKPTCLPHPLAASLLNLCGSSQVAKRPGGLH